MKKALNVYYLGGAGILHSLNWYFDIIDLDTQQNEIVHGYIYSGTGAEFTNDYTMDGTICSPASAEKVISVSSYNTKNSWYADQGFVDFDWLHNNWNQNIPDNSSVVIDDISFFSSKGPLRNEIFSSKPDITAPGCAISSAYSNESVYYSPFVINEISDEHIIKWGTSMSAPHVTGACALLLQKFPYLTCSDLKTILKENANTSYPSGDEKDWGAGKLDILSAYKYMVGYYAQGYIPSFQTAYNNHPYLEGLPIESVDDYWDLTLKQRLTNGMILKPSQSGSAYWLGEEIFITWDSLGNVSSPLGVPDTTEFIDATNNNYRTVDFENGTIYWNGNETIYKYLTANFSADNTSGLNPLTVAFYDSSTAMNTTITSWYWDFGDNEYSTTQDPTHLYNNAGIYNVSLTISDGRNNNTETKNNYINVLDSNTSGFIEGTVSLIGGNGNIEDIEISAGGLTVNPNPTGHYAIGLTSGLYDVTASLNNYQSVTNHDLEVTAGQYTENIIFILISSDIAISVIQDGSGDYTTIQTAIDAANNGNVISVNPGTYTENINYNGKNITVGSLFFTTNDTSYISQTIIDGNQAGSVVTFVTGEYSTAILTGFTITNGVANSGAGICCMNNSNPSLSNVTITNNLASYGGGGIYFYRSSPSLENVTISGNSASSGGGIAFYSSSPSLVDVTIKGNSATGRFAKGGGIYCGSSNPSLTDVTITCNSATGNSVYSGGGGIYFGSSSPSFSSENRCNIYSNTITSSRGYGVDIFTYNCPFIDVIVDTFSVFTPTDYYASPIDSLNFDILHSIEVSLINADVYVSVDGDDSNSGISLGESFKTIKYALSRIYSDSLNHNTIHLASGVYSPSTNGETFPIKWSNYVNLSGSGEGETILDAENTAGVMEFWSVTAALIENITITNGSASGNGGGIDCLSSSPSLVNVTITDNSADEDGGGICCRSNSNPSLSNVTITNNSVSSSYGYGGGIFCTSSSPSLVNVTISNNSATGISVYSGGGGIYFEFSSSNLVNVTICGNSASSGGGGINCTHSSPSLVDVTITGNSATGNFGKGGGIYCYYSNPSLVNVTICGNSASYGGSGIYCNWDSSPSLENCIMWNDLPEEVYFNVYNNPNSIMISYSDIQGGETAIVTNNNGTVYWEEGNIDADPLFVDATNGNYHLTANSPCIDSGDPTSPLDPDCTVADMGAYYYNQQETPAYANIKVFIEGPYNASGDTMICSLTVPTTSPYDNEDIGSLPTVAGHSLVDWIQVKLRTTLTGSTVDSCNAFLLEDGSVVDVNGNSSLPFYNTSGNEYYIVIHHRNHLNIMSAVKYSFGSSPLDNKSGNENYTKKYNRNHLNKINLDKRTFEAPQREATNIDLTIPGSIYGVGYQELETGVFGMYSGDINNDGEVTTSDYTNWYNAYITGSSGYQVTDLNMDGEVTTSDYTKWYNNFIVGASSSVPGQTRESSGKSKKIILRKNE